MSSSELKEFNPGEKIDNRWEVVATLGEGGFGCVYEVKDLNIDGPSNKLFALKIEDKKVPAARQVLKNEIEVLRQLHEQQIRQARSKQHFCELIATGQNSDYNYIVMPRIGKSIEYILRACDGRFTGRSVAHIGIKSLTAIRELHTIGFIHRDIKPSNLALGRPPNYADVYLIDFGLCKSFVHNTGRLRHPCVVNSFIATLPYASVASHRNEDQCRRDDLWSWLYMLIELSTGKLPWHDLSDKVKDLPLNKKVKRIGELKKLLNDEPIKLMINRAVEFIDIYTHIFGLGFYDQPDYDRLSQGLKKMELRRKCPDKDGDILDWQPGGKHHDDIDW